MSQYILLLIQYLISPVVVTAIFLFFFQKMYHLGTISQRFEDALDDIKELKKDTKRLLSHVDIIKTHVVEKTGLDAQLFASHSPLKLSKKGIQILNDSGFPELYQENKQWFLDEVQKFRPITLATIDEACFKILERCRDDKKFTDFKEMAFQHGVSLDVLLRVCAIYMRDEIAKELHFSLQQNQN